MANLQRLASYVLPLGNDPASGANQSKWFNVLNYGAKGDGIEIQSLFLTTAGSTAFVSTGPTQVFSAADQGKLLAVSQGQTITGATNASPIVITTTGNHGLTNGAVVYVSGVQGNTNANGYYTVAGVTANTFQLAGTTGNGAYASGGLVTLGFVTTIESVTDGNNIVMANAATMNSAGGSYFFGSDDSTAIQAALNAARGHGVCYVPPAPLGQFYIVRHAPVGATSPACLRIGPNTRLTGDGFASKIKLIPPTSGQCFDILASQQSLYQGLGGSTAPAPSVVDSNIQIDNLSFDGSKRYLPLGTTGASEHIMFFTRCQDVVISDCLLTNAGADGLVFEYSQNCAALNNQSTGHFKVGFYAPGSEYIVFSNNTSFGDGGGITLAQTWYSTVSGNNVSGWGPIPGVYSGIGLTADCRYNTVTNNSVDKGGLATSNGAIWLSSRPLGGAFTVHGITYGAGADPSVAYPYGCRFNTVVANTATGNGSIGIFLSDYSDWNVVDSNHVSGNAGAGVQLQACQYNIVKNNTVLNNGTNGVLLIASQANWPCWYNTVIGNKIHDVPVWEFTTLTGTVTTNGTTTLAGSGTAFNAEIGAGAVSPPRPILLANASEKMNFVTNVASNTSLTLQNAAATSVAGIAISGPKLTTQVTHGITPTQTAAITETWASGTGVVDFNKIWDNENTGTVTLAGTTSKIYAHQAGTGGRISGTADVTVNSTTAQDLTGCTTGTFTALETGSMILNANVFANIATGPGLGNFLVIECQMSTNGGAYAVQNPAATMNIEGSRTPLSQSWVLQLTAGNTYAIKLTGRMSPANTTTYLVFLTNGSTGFTYRFV